LGEHFYPAVRRTLLQTIDFLWVEHLEAMEYLRSSVNLRAYGQRDPLVEYKKEGLRLFQQLEESYMNRVLDILPHLALRAQTPLQGSDSAQVVHRAAEAITATGKGPVRREYERNDKVTITNGTETMEMKYKRAEPLLATGEWKIVESR
jgi:preprotein translocase subunit SecA